MKYRINMRFRGELLMECYKILIKTSIVGWRPTSVSSQRKFPHPDLFLFIYQIEICYYEFIDDYYPSTVRFMMSNIWSLRNALISACSNSFNIFYLNCLYQKSPNASFSNMPYVNHFLGIY